MKRSLMAGLVSVLVACSGENGGQQAAKDSNAGKDVAQSSGDVAEGTLVAGPSGVTLEIPPQTGGASPSVTVELTDQAVLPDGVTAVGPVLRIGPSGTLFDPPALLRIPIDTSQLPDGADLATIAIFTAPAEDGGWGLLETTVADGVAAAQISHLSDFFPGLGCRKLGQGCTFESPSEECCKPNSCNNDKCTACKTEGEKCFLWGCCEGLICTGDKCQSCRPLGSQCGGSLDCCNSAESACVDGKCTECLPAGFPCDEIGQCCGTLSCVSGVCTDGCAPLGDSCKTLTSEACCGHDEAGTLCIDEVCAACGTAGKPCKETKTCCEGLVCKGQVCGACGGIGSTCSDSSQCCGKKCVGGSCATCWPHEKPCSLGSDCCSGLCKEHTCVSCDVSEGDPCGIDADCCPYDCCDKKALHCEFGKCSSCVEAKSPCSVNSDCCVGLKCVDLYCEPCAPDDTACSPDHPCCSGLPCIQGICQQCLMQPAKCSAPEDCCSKVCTNGQCVNCSGLKGTPCDGVQNTCCEPLQCLQGTCGFLCAPVGKACSQDIPCCEGGACENGTCACAGAFEPCTGIPCCDGAECIDEECVPCSSEGASCGLAGCCPPAQCVGGTCAVCAALGASCPLGWCCDPGQCIDGTCVDCAPIGESCADKQCCAADVCMDGLCTTPIPEKTPCEPGKKPSWRLYYNWGNCGTYLDYTGPAPEGTYESGCGGKPQSATVSASGDGYVAQLLAGCAETDGTPCVYCGPFAYCGDGSGCPSATPTLLLPDGDWNWVATCGSYKVTLKLYSCL